MVKIITNKKVGFFKDGGYTRYRKPRDPSSGIEVVKRQQAYGHVYGHDPARRHLHKEVIPKQKRR